MLDLEDIFGGALDVFGDLVSVGGTELECSQYQHVQRALEQFDPVGGFVWHIAGRYSTFKHRSEGRRPTFGLVSRPDRQLSAPVNIVQSGGCGDSRSTA